MISGIVNTVLEATLQLEIYGSNSQQSIVAVIDTGYNGSLTLPRDVISALGLPPLASRSVTLGDASRKVLDFYEADVHWDTTRKTVAVLCVEGDPLIGTALLNGYKIEAVFVVGGSVEITGIS